MAAARRQFGDIGEIGHLPLDRASHRDFMMRFTSVLAEGASRASHIDIGYCSGSNYQYLDRHRVTCQLVSCLVQTTDDAQQQTAVMWCTSGRYERSPQPAAYRASRGFGSRDRHSRLVKV